MRRLFSYFRAHAPILVFATLCAAVAGATSAAPIALVKFVVDGVLNGQPMPEVVWLETQGLTFGQTMDREALLKFCTVAIVVLYLLNAASQYGQAVLLRGVGLRVVQRLRQELFEKYQRLSLDRLASSSTGDLMSRVISDCQLLQATVQNLVDLLREPLVLLFLLGVAFWTNWRLAAAGLVGLPLIAFSIRGLSKAMRRYARRTQGHLGNVSGILQESLSGAMVVRAFGLEKREIARFDSAHEEVLRQGLKGIRVGAASGPVVIVLGAVGAAVVLWVGGQQVLHGVVTPGDLMAFIIAAMAIYDPIRKLARTYTSLQQALAAGERIFEVLDRETTVPDDGKQEAPLEIEAIGFDSVVFAYEEAPVLRGVSFEAKRGEVIALVGESGAGKSTLLNLVPRFYDATGGNVSLNGSNVRGMTLASLRARMALVTQDTFLFNESVSMNIRQGRPEATQEEVREAAELAHADGFIRELPEGYDTLLGERGARLSGGQRQRIAIARALLRDAPILLLDEATSSLDSESEEEVQKALDELMHNRTTLVIAHRLSTIQNADRIVVLSKGQIVETGTHQELLASEGEYGRLYQIQFRHAGALAAVAGQGA